MDRNNELSIKHHGLYNNKFNRLENFPIINRSFHSSIYTQSAPQRCGIITNYKTIEKTPLNK